MKGGMDGWMDGWREGWIDGWRALGDRVRMGRAATRSQQTGLSVHIHSLLTEIQKTPTSARTVVEEQVKLIGSLETEM